MAVVERSIKSAVNLKLDAGTNAETGANIVRTISLGNVVTGSDAGDVYTVCGNVASLLLYPITRVERVETTQISVA